MISPGFFGIFNAHRALLTSQAALNTINHNIANANTEGYSKQQVDIQAADPYATPSVNTLSNQGQMGQGSVVQQITRLRDLFLDSQYRDENAFSGTNNTYQGVLSQIEGIFSEPSKNGINGALQQFFDAAQSLSVSPESQAVRASYIQQASNMVSTFKQEAQQLYDLRENLVGAPGVIGSFSSSQIVVTANQINDMLTQVAQLNQQIVSVTASGAQPNDLYDQRDRLLDNLSKLTDISVQHFDNGQVNVSMAGGQIMMVQGTKLVDTLTVSQNLGAAAYIAPAAITTTNGGVTLNDFAGSDIQGGTLKGIIDMTQVNAANPNQVNIRNVLQQLDDLFNSIATGVNALQTTGRDLTGAVNGQPMFVQGVPNPAGDPIQLLSWDVNVALKDPINGPPLVAAAADDPLASGPPAGFAGTGDGRNALAIAQLQNTPQALLGNTSFVQYFNSITSNLGIASSAAQTRSAAQASVVNSVDQQRKSVSGVSTDEETIDMLRFQRSFEASSKVIQTYNQIYQTIIGLVS